MAMYIGRAGYDFTLDGTGAWNVAGDQVTVQGTVHGGSSSSINPTGLGPNVSHAEVLRSQLNGYVDNSDEPIVPVLWDEDPRVNGFYKVVAASVSMQGSSLDSGMFPFSVTLDRVASFADPLFESILIGADMVNDFAANGHPWHALPNEHSGYSATVASSSTRASDGDTIRFYDYYGNGYAQTPRFFLPPANWYSGAAFIAASATGTATGHQSATYAADVHNFVKLVGLQHQNYTPGAWCLSNGLVRLVIESVVGIYLDVYSGGAWRTGISVVDFLIKDQANSITLGGASATWKTMRVLRNSPECCIVRLSAEGAGGSSFSYTLDIALRRGAPYITCFLTTVKANANWQPLIGLRSGSGIAATATTTGLRETANNSDGNRQVIGASKTTTKDTTNGTITKSLNSNNGFSFFVGYEIGGSAASAPNDAASLGLQYLAAQDEKMLVVSR